MAPETRFLRIFEYKILSMNFVQNDSDAFWSVSLFLESLTLVRYNKTKRNGVAFEAKTDELAKHYIRDFGAIRVFAKQSGGPIMLMIADNAALSRFNIYLS